MVNVLVVGVVVVGVVDFVGSFVVGVVVLVVIHLIFFVLVSEVLGPIRDPKLNVLIASIYGVVPFSVAVGFLQENNYV